MKKFSERVASLVGEILTNLQCDGSSYHDYVRSTACGGGATV